MISLYSEPEERDEEPNQSGDENIPLSHLATKFKPSLKYNDIRVGDFILVKFLGGKKKTFFDRYICVIQKIYTQDDIEVISQKSFNGKSCFKLKDYYSVWRYYWKIAKPEIQNAGDRMKYVFSKDIDILEA